MHKHENITVLGDEYWCPICDLEKEKTELRAQVAQLIQQIEFRTDEVVAKSKFLYADMERLQSNETWAQKKLDEMIKRLIRYRNRKPFFCGLCRRNIKEDGHRDDCPLKHIVYERSECDGG